MAKVQGPLFSMEASGKFGGALVFGRWKGRATVRQLVIPSNPRTEDQEAARNRIRVTGAIQLWVRATETVLAGETETDQRRLLAATPAGFAWNGWLVETIIGRGNMTYTAAKDAFDALDGAAQTAWNTAAAALSPALTDIYQTQAGGSAGTPFPAGKAFFVYQYGLSRVGLAPVPTATPPTYS